MGLGTPLSVLWLTTFVVNVRHVLYAASLGPDLRQLPRRWRFLLAYLLTDEAFATTAVHYANKSIPNTFKHWFFLGADVYWHRGAQFKGSTCHGGGIFRWCGGGVGIWPAVYVGFDGSGADGDCGGCGFGESAGETVNSQQ